MQRLPLVSRPLCNFIKRNSPTSTLSPTKNYYVPVAASFNTKIHKLVVKPQRDFSMAELMNPTSGAMEPQFAPFYTPIVENDFYVKMLMHPHQLLLFRTFINCETAQPLPYCR